MSWHTNKINDDRYLIQDGDIVVGSIVKAYGRWNVEILGGLQDIKGDFADYARALAFVQGVECRKDRVATWSTERRSDDFMAINDGERTVGSIIRTAGDNWIAHVMIGGRIEFAGSYKACLGFIEGVRQTIKTIEAAKIEAAKS